MKKHNWDLDIFPGICVDCGHGYLMPEKTCGMNMNKPVEEKLKDKDYDNKLPYRLRSKDLAAWEAYHDESNKLYDLFKHDSLTETGLINHPKAEKAFAMAWERGHANGLYEVWYELRELAELLLED